MKKIFLIIMLVGLMSLASVAQKQYTFGYRVGSTLTSATAIAVTPVNTLNIYKLDADTGVTFTAVVTKAVVGDRIVLQVKANTSNRPMAFSTGLVGAVDTIPATKTVMYEFIYTGTYYYNTGKRQVD